MVRRFPFAFLGACVIAAVSSAGVAGEMPLKFMTFNIWGEYFGNPALERQDGVRAAVLRERPDVIAFQEADGNWWRKSTLFKTLCEKDRYDIVKGDLAATLKSGGWAGRDLGRCTVNPQPLAFNRDRLELIDSGLVLYHARISDKGATWAVLRDRVTGFRFIAFSTHFWYQWNGEESDALKETNATALMNALAALKDRYPYPIIGGGDLNSLPGSWAHDLLEGRGLVRAADCAATRDATPTCHGDPKKGADGRWHGKPPPAKGGSLDHVFVETNGIRAIAHRVVVTPEVLDASDHSPVTVTFVPAQGEITALWRGLGLEKAPQEHPAPEFAKEGVKAAFFDSVPWYGKPTRFFAYYALPKDASKEKPVPAVVLVHGGGGTAFWNYVKYWNDKGYAAISMDNCGSIPVNEPGKPGGGEHSMYWSSHEWSGPRGWETFREAYEKPQDQWPFHAVATVILSHSFLRSLPEVDASRIGISGVSWGGYLTCIAASVDHRYRWANPVYGCGFLGDNSVWKEKLDKLGDKGRHWLALWDPSEYLPQATCPFLWVSGQHDFAYPIDSLLKSAALVKRSYYDVPDTFNHGHNPGFYRPSIVAFAAAMNAGRDFPENYPEPYGRVCQLAAADYRHTVRPIGVNGQAAWNARANWSLYPPTFAFTNRADAARYRFTVTDEFGGVFTFDGKTANDSLAPVWAKLPESGWVTVRCDALAADGKTLGLAGTRSFWKQAPFKPGQYAKPKLSHAEAAKRIGLYVMRLPIVKANYLSGKPVPKEMINHDNQTFIAYPSKMGAMILKEMAMLAASDETVKDEALALAAGVVKKLAAITEPAGKPLAGFPLTYENHPGLTGHPAKMIARNAGKVMMIYPGEVADAYLDLFAVTKDAALKTAALKIADRYLALQGADGTWPLNCYLKDAKPVEANRLVPVQLMEVFERVYKLTGDAKYRAAADRAFAYVEKGPLATWNWEGQFEDVVPTPPFQNLTKHNACDTAIYLVKRFPNDAKRLAQARELLRFSEDQFVCWERPCRGVGDDPRGRMTLWGCDSWRCPAVLEQYNCYAPIDASSAKLVRTYLALYRAEKSPLDLAKARALGDALARETHDDGYLPTFWFDFREDWPNCMLASAAALGELAAVGAAGPDARSIDCEGTYGGHLQGVATDGRSLYWSFTVKLVKTDLSGHVLRAIDVENHHGDLCVKDGVVYVAVNVGEFNFEDRGVSEVRAYAAEDLKESGRWALPECRYGAGGITSADGHFFVVGGLPATHECNYIYEYAPGFKFVRRHDLKTGFTLMGLQTAAFEEGRFLFGLYGCAGDPAGVLECPRDLTSFVRRRGRGDVGILRLGGSYWTGVAWTASGRNRGSIDRMDGWPASAAEVTYARTGKGAVRIFFEDRDGTGWTDSGYRLLPQGLRPLCNADPAQGVFFPTSWLARAAAPVAAVGIGGDRSYSAPDLVRAVRRVAETGEAFALHAPGTPETAKSDAKLSSALGAVRTESARLGVRCE